MVISFGGRDWGRSDPVSGNGIRHRHFEATRAVHHPCDDAGRQVDAIPQRMLPPRKSFRSGQVDAVVISMA